MSGRMLPPLLATLLVFSIALAGGEPTGDLKEMQGTWSITAMERGGEKAPKIVLQGAVVVRKDKISFEIPEENGMTIKREFSFKIDALKKPKAIDFIVLDEPNKGMLAEGIYELKGDELTLCVPNGKVDSRPTEMKSPKGSLLIIMSLKRK